VVIARRTGLYIFNGGEPIKISQGIQPTWNQINGQYGHTLWVTVDTKERRIFVGVPLGTSTSPNKIADERSKTAALTKERDDAIRIAKGGSAWHRITRAAKWFLLGAAAGAIIATAR